MSGTKRLDHPEIGALEVGFEVLHLPDAPGHRLMTYTAVEGTAAHHALTLLGTMHQRTHSLRSHRRSPAERDDPLLDPSDSAAG